ncbi:MAG: hypothetical protein COV36_04405 [Alphaproteobacteria bacterium CG11_big_fil_rev_8_21_14_0_20_44_7]|nr:MAG: hypothetical protein COV36_04405 [Alphaproteobacteria bacterium CG11_big_fil_rev_8_21_14_0_20_44_7]
MVTEITLGNISQVGGKTVTSGGSSGIDTAGLIEGLTEAKRLPAVQLETKLATNLAKISEYGGMKSALQGLKDALNVLRNPTGFGSSAQNVFDSRAAFLTTSDGTTAGNYLSVITSNGAAVGSYDIEIEQLALAESYKSVAFADRTSSIVEAGGGSTANMFAAGTFQLNDVDITLTEGDSLNTIVSKINAVKGQTNVEASVLKIASDDFRLILSQRSTGEDNTITIVDGSDALHTATNFPPADRTAPLNAILTFDGETIERQSNTINDIVDNVTFTLFQETPTGTPDTTLTVEIDENTEAVSNAVIAFIDAYNDFRVFFAKQNERGTDGEFLDTAVLNDSILLKNVSDSLINQLALSANDLLIPGAGLSDETSRLGDIGIYFSDFVGDSVNGIPATSKILEIDSATFSAKLQGNFEELREIFEFKFTSEDSNFASLSRGNFDSQETFKVLIDDSAGPGLEAQITHIDGHELATPQYLTYDTSSDEVTGTAGLTAILTGSGELEGLKLYYYGDGTSTEDFTGTTTSGEKDYDIDIDRTAETAQVTKIHGFDLVTAIDLDYSVSASAPNGLATITGQDDTLFDGMSFLYVSSSDAVVNFSFKQGVADKLYNSINDVVGTTNSGLINSQIESLQDSNESLQESIDNIDTQIDVYRERLLIQFSALEAAIAAANSVLQLLDAQSLARQQ